MSGLGLELVPVTQTQIPKILGLDPIFGVFGSGYLLKTQLKYPSDPRVKRLVTVR